MFYENKSTRLATSLMALQLVDAAFGQEAINQNEYSKNQKSEVQILESKENDSHGSSDFLFDTNQLKEEQSVVSDEQLIEMRTKLLQAFGKDESNHGQNQTTLRPILGWELSDLDLFTTELFDKKVKFCIVATSTSQNELHFKFTYNPRCTELFKQESEVLGFTQMADSDYDLIATPELREFEKERHFFFEHIFLDDTLRRITIDKISNESDEIIKNKFKDLQENTLLGKVKKLIENNQRITGLFGLVASLAGVSLLSFIYSRYQSKKVKNILDKKNNERAERDAKKSKERVEKNLKNSEIEPLKPQSLNEEGKQGAQEVSKRFQYLLKGSIQPTIEFMLQPGEQLIAEEGSMLYRDSSIKMYTVGGRDIGFSSGATGIVKRLLSGESFFFVNYVNESDIPAKVNLSPGSIGTIEHFDLSEFTNGLYSANGAFFAADKDTRMSIVTKNSLKGFLSGRGVFQQHFSGKGNLITFCPGKLEKIEVAHNEELLSDTKCLFAWTNNDAVEFRSQSLKDAATNGEGLFVCKIKGPNTIWISSSMKKHSSNSSVGGAMDILT